jgi:hypothetical protein
MLAIEMPNLHRCLTLTALATYFLVGGAVGLCTVWGGLGVEHHHHAGHEAPSHSTICGDHSADHHSEDQQPCRDSADHDSEDFLALTPDSPAPIASPLIGDVLPPAPDFSAAPAPRAIATPACLLGSVRGSPPGPALLCRFLV